jgi:hypothetical protein
VVETGQGVGDGVVTAADVLRVDGKVVVDAVGC